MSIGTRKHFQKILFPVDFSPKCVAMAPSVARVAGQFGSEVILLHSLNLPPAGYGEWYAYAADVSIEDMMKSARAGVERFAKEHLPNTEVQTIVDAGGPLNTIVDAVNHLKVDLVMMPTHGYGKFRSLLLGSVTSAVLHDVHCAVWTDAHAAGPPVIPEAAGEQPVVLCAVDLAPSTVHVLAIAKDVAQKLGARLHVVHSEPAIEDPVKSESAARFRRFLVHTAIEDFAPLAALADVATDIEVIEGPVGAAVARSVAKHRAELVVIGRGTLQGTLGRLRTHAHDIIRRSPCAVLSV